MKIVKAIEITVTAEDICRAVPGDPKNCAYAQAIKREYPEAKYINVGNETIKFTRLDQRKRYKFRTSLTAQAAQEKFDNKDATASDFPPVRLYLDEAVVTDIEFSEEKRAKQQKRRDEVRAGKREVKPVSAARKAAIMANRRHA